MGDDSTVRTGRQLPHDTQLRTESVSSSPPFGQADLSNCEREQIHLAGSVQPHGWLWVLSEPHLCIVQASSHCPLPRPLDWLLQARLRDLGGSLEDQVRQHLAHPGLQEGLPLRCRVELDGRSFELEGMLHRNPDGLLIVELEPAGDDGSPTGARPDTVDLPGQALLQGLSNAVQRLSEAETVPALAEALVGSLRQLVGYERVMVYRFDPEGHGEIIAESCAAHLDPLLGHHYPATDIPQRARALYLRNRVRVLVDVDAVASPVVDAQGLRCSVLDMSMCCLRSMSPLHLQYLRNMGVTATLVISLVREGRLWGLIACHHNQARKLRLAMRSAADLLSEAATTRLTAIENFARAQRAAEVRRLEQRLIEATASEGDWRPALFRDAQALLRPLEASGVALFQEGQWLAGGEAPDPAQLQRLRLWVEEQAFEGGAFCCASIAQANPALADLTARASGVLAVRLAAVNDDMLFWFRREQLRSVTWAGDPAKVVLGDNPLELSPRRSFAAWSQLVRGTALPWTSADVALGCTYGAALVDIIAQVSAVRLLIAEHQVLQMRASMANSREAVVVADASGRAFYANDAFLSMAGCTRAQCADLAALAQRFADPALVRRVTGQVQAERRAWHGELVLAREGQPVVSVRAEPVPARDGSMLGLIFMFEDMTASKRADAARSHLQASLSDAGRSLKTAPPGASTAAPEDELMAALLTNASLAAMDVCEDDQSPALASLLEALEISTRRSASLYGHIRAFSGSADGAA